MSELTRLWGAISECRVCEAHLPLGPRPICVLSPEARILIIGQAPGTKVHVSGIPWDDPSGQRLREWMGLSRDEFYDPKRVAILPMGLCYPGSNKSGDLPPRPECAPLWHPQVLPLLRPDRLTILIGRYARERYLPEHESLTEAVGAYDQLLPDRIALPHPSPRNRAWLSQNPWFLERGVPTLRAAVRSRMV